MKPPLSARWRLVIALLFIPFGLHISAANYPRGRSVSESYPNDLNSNSIPITLQAYGEAPEFMAIVIQEGEGTFEDWDEDPEVVMEKMRANAARRVAEARRGGPAADPFAQAKWVPFQTNTTIDLGPGDGPRKILFSYRYKGDTKSNGYSGSEVTVRTVKPTITVLNPTNMVTSQPVIQIQGMASRPHLLIHYDRYNQEGDKMVADEQGHIGTFGGDTRPGSSSSRYFTCFDVELDRGTNRFVFRLEDAAGNKAETNFVIIFSLAEDRTPPKLSLGWPLPGMQLTGDHFTARGRCDDNTATLAGRIIGNGKTNFISGVVERGGTFWYEDLPLALGENQVRFTALDPAGNGFSTNFVVIGSDGPVVTIDEVDPKMLWNSTIKLTGKVQPANCDVWINGVLAKVDPNGGWVAENVPVKSPNGGGTATFQATAVPKATAKSPAAKSQPPAPLK